MTLTHARILQNENLRCCSIITVSVSIDEVGNNSAGCETTAL